MQRGAAPIRAACMVALALPGTGAQGVARAGGDELEFAARVRPFLATHCIRCHGGDEPRADLDLEAFPSAASVSAAAETFELLRDLLEAGDMPPVGEPRPPKVDVEHVLAFLDDALGRAPEEGPIDPGPAPLRRLSRTEYRNTVRDLVGVEFDVEEYFPPDALGHGFDTSTEAQSLPELLLERYVEAAFRIAETAIAIDDTRDPRSWRLDGEALRGPEHEGDAVALWTAGEARGDVELPRAGRYAVRVRAFADQAGEELARLELRADRKAVGEFEVRAGRGDAEHFEVQCELPAGEVRVAAAFLNDYYDESLPESAPRDRNLFIEWLEVLGPLDRPAPTSFQADLLARFGPELGVERLPRALEHLLLRAWRRPPAASELRRVQGVSGEEEPLEARLRAALAAMLASPNFLFLVEIDPPPSSAVPIRELSGHELATRLSYLLWSTLPDEELLALAAEGRLGEEAVLLAQVERLLADPRSRAFSESFSEQWLQVRRLDISLPDPERYPEFDEELRASMRAETVLFFDELLRRGESVWALLDADWTMADARLAKHYGVAPPAGDGFARVDLSDTDRRGVLGQASILTATSFATRTSPVVRGKWILEVLLGAPPPPPPPGADSLANEEAEHPELSFREQLALHRADPSCAACHAVMDPLGFGLEGFDAIGRRRGELGGLPVDARGVLPDGRAFDGPLELAELLRADGRLVRALSEQVLVYALGRGLSRADRRAVDRIVAALDPEHPTLAQILREVVRSDPFRKRRGDTRAVRRP